MATQNYYSDSSAVSLSPQQSISQDRQQQQPRKMDTAVPIISPMMFDDDKCRSRAKGVAIADICISCCCLTLMIILLVLTVLVLSLAAALNIKQNPVSSRLAYQTLFNFSIAEIVIVTALVIIDCVAAVGLKKATKPSTDPSIANRKANWYQVLTVLLVFFNFNFGCISIVCGMREDSDSMIINGGLHLGFAFIRILFIFLTKDFVEKVGQLDSMGPNPVSATASANMMNNPTNQPPNNPYKMYQRRS